MLFGQKTRTAVDTIHRSAIDEEGSVASDLGIVENIRVGGRDRAGLSLLGHQRGSVGIDAEDFGPQVLIGPTLGKGAGEKELRSIVGRAEPGKLRVRPRRD